MAERPRNNLTLLVIGAILAFVLTIILMFGSGCADPSYLLQRAMLNADCRPGHLQPDGQCTPLGK